MNRETLLHVDRELKPEEKRDLIEKMEMVSGGQSRRYESQSPHMMFVSFNDEKIAIHDLPVIASAHGVNASVIDF